MSKRKKVKVEPPSEGLTERIKKLVEGLYYSSETDAEIEPFSGEKANAVTIQSLLEQTHQTLDSENSIKEKNFNDFFARLTKLQDWYGDEEKEIANRFSKLKDFLQKELTDLKVFKIGTTQINIYVVGLDSENRMMGVSTQAVET